MIKPTVGRVVLFHPGSHFEGSYTKGVPLPALVACVWSNTCINIGGFDANGKPFSATSVFLIQDDAPVPNGGNYAEWMPYQKAQAEKHAPVDKPAEIPATPQSSNSDIEREIVEKGLSAPRVTPNDVDNAILHECYFVASDAFRFAYLTADIADAEERKVRNGILESMSTRTYSGTCLDIDHNNILPVPAALNLLTFCVLVLHNGFTVTGESACASPENFDAEIGRKIARQSAVNKIWPLLGYALKEKLSSPK